MHQLSFTVNVIGSPLRSGHPNSAKQVWRSGQEIPTQPNRSGGQVRRSQLSQDEGGRVRRSQLSQQTMWAVGSGAQLSWKMGERGRTTWTSTRITKNDSLSLRPAQWATLFDCPPPSHQQKDRWDGIQELHLERPREQQARYSQLHLGVSAGSGDSTPDGPAVLGAAQLTFFFLAVFFLLVAREQAWA